MYLTRPGRAGAGRKWTGAEARRRVNGRFKSSQEIVISLKSKSRRKVY